MFIQYILILSTISYSTGSLAAPNPLEMCELPSSPGKTCQGSSASADSARTMYYFNSAQQACLPFNFLGCEGNHNKFETQTDCKNVCQFTWNSVSASTESSRVKDGEEPHTMEDCKIGSFEVGPCKAMIPMWYYNVESKKCDQFTYGGCQGNGNKYVTKENCEQLCLNN